MRFVKYTFAFAALLIGIIFAQPLKSLAQSQTEKVPYEFIISRSNDDFTPAVSGATIALASLSGERLDIQLTFRVGRRITFSSLTEDVPIDCHPVWNPKTQDIVFDSNRNQKIAIWTLPLSENTPRLLIGTSSGMVFGAAFSPDGEEVAYVSAKNPDQQWWTYYVTPPVDSANSFAVIIRDMATGREKKVADGMFPAFSPDGKKLAYSVFDGYVWNLWIKDLITGAKKRLTSSKYNDFYPSFSPDGKWIAFVRENPVNHLSDIWVVNLANNALVQITSTSQHNEGGPFWNGDGIYIHTDSGNNTPYDIALIPPEVLPAEPQKVSEATQPDISSITIQILNSTRIPKLAARTAELLKQHGYNVVDVGNTRRERNLYKGKIYYKPGLRAIARKIAEIIPGTQRLYESNSFKYDIVVVLGRNTRL